MKSIDLYYQGEGLGEIAHVELEPDATFGSLKARLVDRHGVAQDALLFVEDEDEPLDESAQIKDRASGAGLKVHVHRCRRVKASVTFNCDTVERRFPPSATVARVKRWAAVQKFGMSKEEASEHVLQIAGTYDRPAPGTHIGSLTTSAVCALAFDLVPDERVNGAAGDAP